MNLKITLRRGAPETENSQGVGNPEDQIKAALAWGTERGADYVRRQISMQHPFEIKTGKAAFLWSSTERDGKIRIFSPIPYVKYLNYGWQSQPMTWLVGKTIPLDGGTKFRRVTQRALDQGKWVRPFRPPTYFLENAIRALLDDMKAEFPALTFTHQTFRWP